MKKILFVLLFLATNCFAQVSATYNTNVTYFASGVQTGATVNSADMVNTSFHGGHFIINISAYTSGNYTVHIQGKDPVSGTYYDILVSPALSATGITILKVMPGITTQANAATADILPLIYRVQLIGAASPSMTLSVSAMLEL